MRRLLFIFVGFFLLAAPLPAAAQDSDRETRRALAERAVEAMQGEQMAEMVHQMTMAFPPPEFESMSGEQQIAFEEVMAEMTVTITDRVMDGTAEIYADIFTLEELEAMVAFYESPVGQSIMAKSYAATPQMIELIRSMMPQIVTDMINGYCDRLDCSEAERRQAIREALAGLGMSAS